MKRMNAFREIMLSAAMAVGVSLAVQAAADFYWNPAVTSGNWSDAASWCSDAACTKTATSYPKSADTAHIVSGTTATIYLTEKLSVRTIDLTKDNVNITLAGLSDSSLSLTYGFANNAIGANSTLTLDAVVMTSSGGWTMGAGAKAIVKNNSNVKVGAVTIASDGSVSVSDSTFELSTLTLNEGTASFYASASTVTSGSILPGAGTTVELVDGSQMTAATSKFQTQCALTLRGRSQLTFTGEYDGGGAATVTIDDSTLWGKNFFYLGNNGGGDHYVFKGANPVMKGTGNYFRGNGDAKQSSSLYFDFEVPVGGFAEPPVQNFNAYKSLWMNGTAANHPVYISILETSPALKSTDYTTTCPLVYSPYGIYLTVMSPQGGHTYTYTQLDGTTAKAKDNAASKYLNVTLGSGDPAPAPAVEKSAGVSGRTKVDVSRRTFTVTSDITALATTGTTRARLLAGESKTALSEVSTKEVTAVGEVSFVWTAPETKLNNTYYFQIVLETLNGDTVAYSESSPLASGATQDTTVYTWQAVDGVWDGNWSDRAHWAADTGDDRLDYPQTTSCFMQFPADQAVTITVDRALTVGKMRLNKEGIDVTLENAVADKTQNKMVGIISCDGAYKCSITFKYLEFKNNDNVFPGSGKKIRFENGYFWTGGYYQGKGTTELYLKDSTCSIGSYVTISSDGVSPTRTITLDNSQMTVGGNFCASYYKYGHILFKGQNPKLYLKSADKTIYSELDGVDAGFEFEIPVGGFTEPPITCVSTSTKKAFNDTKKLPAFNFVVLETSPALMTAGDTTYPLMTWTPGITTGRVNFDGVVTAATDTFLYGDMTVEGYAWQPVATSSLSNPTAIGVKIHGLTSTDIVTVQGNPGNFGVASPAYGKTTGHVAGETATYSVPEPVFESEGVSYSVTGYVVSNVLADLSHEFACEGKASSFEYTHPNNATVVTWLWGRAFALAVSATAGGSVTPTSKTCAEGEVVEVTATPDSGYAFYKWTGDTEGIADVTQPTISVTMDRARTLTANFGASVEVNTVDAFTAAVANSPDGSTITVAKGEYQLSSGVYLSKAIKVVGATGNPADVVFHGGYSLTTKLTFQVFTLNHAEARLESVTVSDGYLGENYNYGIGIRIAAPNAKDFKQSVSGGLGGTVVNCIVRNCTYNRIKQGYASVYVDAANALVDRCVITNNVVNRQTDSGSNAGAFLQVAGGGVVRNTLIADNRDVNDQGAASVYILSNSSLVNCTVVNNSIEGTAAVGGVQTKDATARVVNCVIAGNTTKAATASYASWAGNADSFVHCALDQYAPNDSCYAGAGLGLKSLAQKEYRPINGSACIDFGSEANYGTSDLDGAARVSGAAVDAGCYEFDQNQFAVGFTADVVSGFAPLEVTFTPSVSGVSAGDELELKWDFDNDGTFDQTTTTLDPVAHTYAAGVYSVRLEVANKTAGKSLPMTNKDMITSGAKVLYVDKNNQSPVVPYDTPEKAAANVQDAIDAAIAGAEVRIYDGDYPLTKEIAVEKEITLTSVSGNRDGVILRGGIKSNKDFRVMAINAGPGALVHSLTIADGYTYWGSDTGGIYLHTKGGTVSNCVVTGCAGCYKFDHSSGVYASGANALVTHCILSNNFGRAGFSDGANPSGSAIALFGGARCEHTLITRNVMGAFHGGCQGVGPSQNTVHVGAASYLRFCTVVSNDAYCVAGVNVADATAHVEYCVIAGNHSRHADETTYGGAENTGKANAPADQVDRWNVWGTVGSFDLPSGATDTPANRDNNVCTQERANATAAVAAAFVNCATDSVKPNDTGLQATADELFRRWRSGRVVSRKMSPAVDVLDSAQFDLPGVDIYGKPRVQGSKLDLGAIETSRAGLGIIVR